MQPAVLHSVEGYEARHMQVAPGFFDGPNLFLYTFILHGFELAQIKATEG